MALILIGLLMVVSLIIFLVYWFGTGQHSKQPPDPEPETPPLMCSFEGEDVFNEKVYSTSGTLVVPGFQDACSNCVQYVYKDSDGCVPLGYDETQGEPVCIAGFRNVTGNWSVPPAKTC
jgi:hypothetical protein